MRLKTPVSPLIFALFSADALLDLMEMQKDGRGNFPLTVCLCESRYYLCAYPKLKFRRTCRETLGKFGEFIGSGYILEAFLLEHGKLLVAQKLLR